jgi:transposase
MEVLHPHAAGLDVHKRTVVAAIQTPTRREVRSFRTMTTDLERLAAWLREAGVTQVAMESTGVYWQPVYTILEAAAFCQLWVVNAQHIKAVPGRKTDVNDAQWLCQLLRHGLVRASFIPAREQRALRDLVRYRKALIRERATARNRLQKTLEGANLKLGAVVSDILGVSSRAMLTALAAGQDDPHALASLARGQLASKEAELVQALTGRLTDAQRFLLGEHLAHIAELDARIERLSVEVARRMSASAAPDDAPDPPVDGPPVTTPDPHQPPADPPAPAVTLPLTYEQAVALLDTIPGLGRPSAEAVVTEIGVDMTRFPSAAHLASWTGVCPGQHQSADKRGSGKTRKGNPWLKEALVEAAGAAAKKQGSYLQARYRRLAGRRGRKRALVAIAHTLVEIIYHVLSTGQPYRELGGAYLDQRNQAAALRQARGRLERLGYDVTLTPRTALTLTGGFSP